MRYKLLGASGLRVSDLALGTMTFGETWGWGAYEEESRKIFDELSDEQLQRLTAAAPISLGFPHSFLASQHVTELIFGETRPLIDA